VGCPQGQRRARTASCAGGGQNQAVCVCRGHGLDSFLGERERRDDGSSPHKQGRRARGRGLSPGLERSVDLATGLECPLGGSTIDLNLGLRPGDDIARQGLGAAGSQVVHFARGQLAVPDVEMGQLANKCLGGIKPTTQSVLWRRVGMRVEGLGWLIWDPSL
jgi:hypothetical protein